MPSPLHHSDLGPDSEEKHTKHKGRASVFIRGSDFSTTVSKNKKGDVMRKRLFCSNEGSRNGLCMIHTGSHGNVF